jgi:hypothetical protein
MMWQPFRSLQGIAGRVLTFSRRTSHVLKVPQDGFAYDGNSNNRYQKKLGLISTADSSA